METTIATALNTFITTTQGLINDHYAQYFPTLTPDILSVDMGRRYAKVVRSSPGGSSRSVYCFIDLINGDILKAASWKAPAKTARGNILAPNQTTGTNPYGANYLTGRNYSW